MRYEPGRFLTVIESLAYVDDPSELEDRVRQCVGTHPTASFATEAVRTFPTPLPGLTAEQAEVLEYTRLTVPRRDEDRSWTTADNLIHDLLEIVDVLQAQRAALVNTVDAAVVDLTRAAEVTDQTVTIDGKLVAGHRVAAKLVAGVLAMVKGKLDPTPEPILAASYRQTRDAAIGRAVLLETASPGAEEQVYEHATVDEVVEHVRTIQRGAARGASLLANLDAGQGCFVRAPEGELARAGLVVVVYGDPRPEQHGAQQRETVPFGALMDFLVAVDQGHRGIDTRVADNLNRRQPIKGKTR